MFVFSFLSPGTFVNNPKSNNSKTQYLDPTIIYNGRHGDFQQVSKAPITELN